MENKIKKGMRRFFGSQRGKFVDLSPIRELTKKGVKVYY